MAVFTGQPGVIARFLGFLDSDDAENTPVGLAALARNCDFPGTGVMTRAGFNQTMQCADKSPVTGLMGMVYTPETDTESFFQLPLAFQLSGTLQYEKPVGSGQMVPITPALFTPPKNAHMISTQPYNKGWLAFSDLSVPKGQMACFDPKAKTLDPYGMKPFGWTWLPTTQVLLGEVATPTAPGGNGHTYRCTIPGTTGAGEPTWPLAENGTVVDGSATWEEYTAVMANRLPSPIAPVVTRDPGSGTFAAGRDVYFILTFQNAMGESLPGPPSLLSNTVLDDAVLVAMPNIATLPKWVQGLSTYAITGVRVYEADVAHGAPAPPQTSYQYVSTNALGIGVLVTEPSTSGIYPPTINSARITPGQLPTPDIGPTIQRISSGGTFPVGRDVYVLQTYLNAAGETPAGPANSIINTQLNDGIGVTVAPVSSYPQITQVNIYECDVPTGSPAPNSSQFALVGTYAIAATPTITASATGNPPPIANGTGPAGNIAADNATGGINGSQGYRYSAIMFMNRNESVSGFTPASVIQYVVDEDGWELSFFNVATGPSNIIARIIAPTVADGTQDGDFWWIGNVNPQIPSANFVYPQTIVDDGIAMSATVFYDNVTTQGTFNFTDEYLDDSNNVTDRLNIMWPAPCVHIAYLPSVDRMCQTGIGSGCRMSLAAAPEDYYADTSDIPIESADGERAWGTFEYRSTIYLIRERSGFTLSASTSNPDEWTARRKWSKVGACGPRAFDTCDDFFIFVHRSGIYRFEDTNPDLMTKEIPYYWQEVNWAAATTVCVKIDRETHTVHVLLPVGNSTVPNQELVINYYEGWQNPIHYSTYSAKEIAMDAARKISINDMAAFVCDRIERTLPSPPDNVMGDDGIPLTPASFYQTQFVFGSSGPDGTVQAITPGVYNDNGAGIDWQYETVAPQATMALSKIEGFTLNARGNGKLYPRLLAGRQMITGQDESGNDQWGSFLALPPLDVSIDQGEGLSMAVQGRYNEKWRLGFSNGKVPDAWFMLKWAALYSIPMFSARSGNPTK